MRHDLEVLLTHLREQRLRVRPQRGLELEVPDAAVPSRRFAVRRQKDERVAGNPPLADRARQLPELGGVLEVARGLEEAERPAWRQRRSPEQLRHHAHEGFQISRDQEVPRQGSVVGRVLDPHAVVRATHGENRIARIVEEQAVAAARDQQRQPDVRARSVAEVRVPELARLPEAIEAPAAVAEPVEVLLAREGEARADAPAAVGARLRGHPAVRRLAQEPGAGGVRERQSERSRGHLESEGLGRQADPLLVDDLERRLGPVTRLDERRRLRPPITPERDADEARAADADDDRPALAGEAQRAPAALEA